MADSTPGGVLWDLDGTLVDSADLHWRSWRETLAREDVAITYEQFLDSFGQRNDGILRRWLGPDTPSDRLARIDREKESAYRRLVEVVGLTPLPGAAEWIRRLHAAGWRQAIASSAPRENVTVMLRALGVGRELDAIAAAEDVTAGKPDPQVFLRAAERLGLPPDRCIVVEDAAAGVEAARRAGMRSIGVSRGRPLPADLVVVSLTDLPADAFDDLLQRSPHTHA
jgi:HAD superfamily hydrolase (TIGR01509 family)